MNPKGTIVFGKSDEFSEKLRTAFNHKDDKDDEDDEDYENYDELQFEEFIDPSDQSQLHPITIKKNMRFERKRKSWLKD